MLKKMIAQEIQDLKQGGYSPDEVRDHLRERMGKGTPSMPTIRKYHDMDGVPEDLHAATAKPHAFDAEPFRSDILEILALNPDGYTSSVSEKVMAELYEARRRRRPDEPPTAELRAQWRAVAKKAIDASLELADELEAA